MFCLASSAYAVQLSLTADAYTPTAYISGYLDQDVYVVLDSYEGIDVVLGPVVGPGSGPTIPPPLIPVDSPLPPWEEIWILTSQTPPLAGEYMVIGGIAGDTVTVAWFDGVTGGGGLIGEVILVPEPATVALLALGGILLLRRQQT